MDVDVDVQVNSNESENEGESEDQGEMIPRTHEMAISFSAIQVLKYNQLLLFFY